MTEPMYKTCPKCGYERNPGDTGPTNRCPHCGLYFEKWLKRRFRSATKPLLRRQRHPADESANPVLSRVASGIVSRLKPLMFPPSTRVNGIALFARAALWLVLVVWGGWFILTDHRTLFGGLPEINYSIMHTIDLVFHEAGHVLFTILGNFMMVLGGTLMQLIVPGVAAWALLFRQKDPFGASVAAWWFAQSLMDVAPYIYDARRQELLLLGGGTGRDRPGSHDWNNLLGRTGLLEYDHALAWLVDATAVLLMLAALCWGGLLLRTQYRVWRAGPYV